MLREGVSEQAGVRVAPVNVCTSGRVSDVDKAP
jgi:hypothetical protein